MEQLLDEARLATVEAFEAKTDALTEEYLSMQKRLASVADELLRARQLRIDELVERERLAERLEGLIEILPGAVLIIDGDGIIMECNRCAPEWLGTPLIGVNLATVLGRQLQCEGAAGQRLLTADGRWLSAARTPLPNSQGELWLLTDDTEAEQLRTHLARQNRLAEMGEMSARLAHQVRTPLGAATLYLTQLTTLIDNGSDAERYLGSALERLRDLERLVNDMLLFAGGTPATMQTVDLESLIDDVVETFAPQLDDPFQIRWAGAPAKVHVRGSRYGLFNALSNLLTNALQFTPDGENVSVELCATMNVARISVRDHGPGIPVEYHDRVFEPFFSTKSNGTGLGLAVVRAVVGAHGGEVEIIECPDGAEVVIELPLVSASPPAFAESVDTLTTEYHA